MVFVMRIVVALVLGWTLGVVAAHVIVDGDIGVMPAVIIPFAVPLVYALSFLVVPVGGRRR